MWWQGRRWLLAVVRHHGHYGNSLKPKEKQRFYQVGTDMMALLALAVATATAVT
jgi:hypothetical protein